MRLQGFVVLALLFLSSSLMAAEITEIPASGSNTSDANAINNKGEVAGSMTSGVTGETSAFVFYNNHVTYIGGSFSCQGCTPVQTTSAAINDSGQIVGNQNFWSTFDGLQFPANGAFSYSKGQFNYLSIAQEGTDFEGAGGSVYGINNAGQIVGSGLTGPISESGNGNSAFVYTGGQYIELSNFGAAYAINNRGQVALSGAYIYSIATAGFTYMGTLLGSDSLAIPAAINDSGDVVGFDLAVTNSISTYRAFLYSNGTLSDLGSLGGSNDNQANAINSEGQIVGESDGLAFLYENGHMIDLNTLLPAN